VFRESSVTEQRYQAVLSVIEDGLQVSPLCRRRAGALADRSHRPSSCPHQMPAAVEAAVLELRRCSGPGVPGGSWLSWHVAL
jgi:hypothetical protein